MQPTIIIPPCVVVSLNFNSKIPYLSPIGEGLGIDPHLIKSLRMINLWIISLAVSVCAWYIYHLVWLRCDDDF